MGLQQIQNNKDPNNSKMTASHSMVRISFIIILQTNLIISNIVVMVNTNAALPIPNGTIININKIYEPKYL